MPAAQRGHRERAHTADVILEAWGPDLEACCEEAVAALVATFAGTARAVVVGEHRDHLPPAGAESLVEGVLDAVLFVLDTATAVPIAATVQRAADGGLDLAIVLADRDSVQATGAVPKAVSRSDLEVTTEDGRIRCRFVVDV